jgi:hypothetical protein
MLKWLLLAVAALALLLYLHPFKQSTTTTTTTNTDTTTNTTTPTMTSPTPSEPQLIDHGEITIMVRDVKIGDEQFKYFKSDGGFELSSDVHLDLMGQKFELTPTAKVDRNLQIQSYDLTFKSPVAEEKVNAKFDQSKTASVTITSSGQSETRPQTGTPPWVLVDSNVNSHFYLFYRLLKARDAAGLPPFAGTLLIPQAEVTYNIKLRSTSPAKLHLPDKDIAVIRYDVQMGDYEIALYGQGDTFYAVEYISQQTVAYRSDLLSALPGFIYEKTPDGK